MKDRPILFSGPMILALLDGRKTQTRRVFTKAHGAKLGLEYVGDQIVTSDGPEWNGRFEGVKPPWAPFGQPGDRLWVRESWQFYDWCSDGFPHIKYQADGKVIYHDTTLDDDWADKLAEIWNDLSDPGNYAIDGRAADRRWRPSIHMPRWASRITLEVTGVRVERVQDIGWVDAVAEGCNDPRTPEKYADTDEPCGDPVAEFMRLWNSINAARGFGWDQNPWCWVVEFRRLEAQALKTLASPTSPESTGATQTRSRPRRPQSPRGSRRRPRSGPSRCPRPTGW